MQKMLNKEDDDEDEENEADKKDKKQKQLTDAEEKSKITRGRMGIMLPERNAFDFVVRPGERSSKFSRPADSEGKSKKDGETGK